MSFAIKISVFAEKKFDFGKRKETSDYFYI